MKYSYIASKVTVIAVSMNTSCHGKIIQTNSLDMTHCTARLYYEYSKTCPGVK